MVRAVVKRNPHIDDGIPGQASFSHRLYDPLLDCRYVLLGNHPSHDLVDEFVPPTARERLQLNPAIAVLSMTPGLFLMLPLNLSSPVNGLLVRHAGRLHLDIKSELPLETIDRELYVGLAHPGQDGLLGLRIASYLQGWILLAKPMESHTHFFFIPSCLGRDGILDDGVWNPNRFQTDWASFVAEGITCGCLLQFYDSPQIRSEERRNRNLILAPKQHYLADPFFAPFGTIVGV